MITDFFSKKEWHDRISVTFRYVLRDPHKTLTTAEADAISNTAHTMLQKEGGEIR